MRRALAGFALAALLSLIAATSATPEGLITIQGAPAGTHLRLSVEGGELAITGPMAGVSEGCRFTRGHGAARCPLARAGGIEVTTGSANDKVEVLQRLPLPLTVHLGAGSDKLIGAGERDTCYPEGTPRNRCIGGGGNDVCIAANINTDCVGDDGDDYCRTGGGSDGCWGGPGDDVCLMGGGEDGCHGEGGRDRLYGGAGADQLYGGSGPDLCDGLPGVGKQHECELRPRTRRHYRG